MTSVQSRVGGIRGTVAIVGAGFGGLAAAYDLAKAGFAVTVFEAAAAPGGLAAGFRDESWDWSLEHFYHHLFASDKDMIALVRESGFDGLLTRRPVTAQWHGTRPYALDGILPVLAFGGVPFIDRVRLGLVVLYLKLRSDWRSLENETALGWLSRWMGPRVTAALWEPLLFGKFGDRYTGVPMSWFWARIHARTPSLLYFAGGFQAFADHLASQVEAMGARVRFQAPVRRIRLAAGAGLELESASGTERFDHVIVTTGPHLLTRMAPDLPSGYLAGLEKLDHLGAVVVVLALSRQLMERIYWLGLDKRTFPFLALVEHTNFMPREHYGGDVLVYMGDYLPPSHPTFALSDEALLAEWLPALTAVQPQFDPSWVRRSWVFRAAYAQPVPPLGFSAQIPSMATPWSGLWLASMSQVYPWDRGTNYAVEIGRRAAREVVGVASSLW